MPAPFPKHKLHHQHSESSNGKLEDPDPSPRRNVVLVCAINPFTEVMLLPSSHVGVRIYCLPNPSQQRLESRQSGICTESIHLQLAGPQDQMWASRKLESSAANPKWVAQLPPNWRISSICTAQFEFVHFPLKFTQGQDK